MRTQIQPNPNKISGIILGNCLIDWLHYAILRFILLRDGSFGKKSFGAPAGKIAPLSPQFARLPK